MKKSMTRKKKTPPSKKRSPASNSTGSSPDNAVISLAAAVNLLADACRTGGVSKQRINLSVKMVEQASADSGLNEKQLEALVDVAGGGKLNKTQSKQIIKSLVPCAVVPYKAISKAVAWICQSGTDNEIKNWLLRWILVVYEHIDNKSVLMWMYGLLFSILQRLELRPLVCELLSRVTQRENVKMFRVKSILEMIKLPGILNSSVQTSGGAKVATEYGRAELLRLLSVYKMFCPHLVPISLPGITRWSLKRDRAWLLRVAEVRSRVCPSTNPLLSSSGAALFTVQGHTTAGVTEFVKSGVAKRMKLSAVPSLSSSDGVTLHVSQPLQTFQHSRSSSDSNLPVPATQVKHFKFLLQNITNIQLPEQIACILRNKYLQYLFSCCDEPSAQIRLNYWLEHTLFTEFSGSKQVEHRQRELLELICNLCEFLQEGIPAHETFLMFYLPEWNGRSNRDMILNLITRWRLCEFSVLKHNVLQFLYKVYINATEYYKLDIMICLMELLKNFTSTEWPRYRSATRNSPLQSVRHRERYLFREEVEDFDGLDTIVQLIYFIEHLCVLGLRQHNRNLLISHVSLSFYEQVADLFTHNFIPVLFAPSPAFIYSCLLHHNASVLSRMCGIIVRFRQAFSSLRNNALSGSEWSESDRIYRRQCLHASVPRLNEYIKTVCDVLWKGNTNSLLSGVSEKLLHKKVGFCLSEHSALIAHACGFISETQPEGYTGKPSSIMPHRNIYLTYLSRQGLEGVTSFVKSSVLRSGNNSSGRD